MTVDRAAVGPGVFAAPELVRPRQFGPPAAGVPGPGETATAADAAMAEEQASVAGAELVSLQADLNDATDTETVRNACEDLYQRLVSWRHTLGVEERHLFGEAVDDPDLFVRPSRSGSFVRHSGNRRRAGQPTTRPAADSAGLIDGVLRARHQLGNAPEQRLTGPRALRNIVTLPGGEPVEGVEVGSNGLGFVTAGPANQQWSMHDVAVDLLAELLPAHGVGSTHAPAPQVHDTFCTAAYLLFQSPLYLCGADDVIRVFLVIVADFLFAEPFVVPPDLDLQALMRPQNSLRGVTGFAEWLAGLLPPVRTSAP